MKKSISIIVLLAGFVSFLFLSACDKPKTCKAIITVVDSQNKPVSMAKVFLNTNNSNPPGEVSVVKQTTPDGKTYYEFPLEAILQVEASKGMSVAKNNIHVIPGKTVTMTIQL